MDEKYGGLSRKKVVNLIKSRPLNAGFFNILGQGIGNEHFTIT